MTPSAHRPDLVPALLALLIATAVPAAEPVADTFNYVVGTQTFSPAYQFMDQPRLVETARAIRDLGSNTLAWGCRFVLYWQVYNNEIAGGKQVGFWMIDDRGARRPIHETHARCYAWARAHVAEARRAGPPPTAEAFRGAAVRFLDALPAGAGD